MTIAQKDYIWNKIRKAKKEYEKKHGAVPEERISVSLLSMDPTRSDEPIEVIGFDDPAAVMRTAESVEFTGNGENGIAEPDLPVDLLDTTNGPAIVHEDEAVVKPNGAAPNQRAILSQEDLKKVEKL